MELNETVNPETGPGCAQHERANEKPGTKPGFSDRHEPDQPPLTSRSIDSSDRWRTSLPFTK